MQPGGKENSSDVTTAKNSICIAGPADCRGKSEELERNEREKGGKRKSGRESIERAEKGNAAGFSPYGPFA